MKTYNVIIDGVMVGSANGESESEALDQACEYYGSTGENTRLEFISGSIALWDNEWNTEEESAS